MENRKASWGRNASGKKSQSNSNRQNEKMGRPPVKGTISRAGKAAAFEAGKTPVSKTGKASNVRNGKTLSPKGGKASIARNGKTLSPKAGKTPIAKGEKTLNFKAGNTPARTDGMRKNLARSPKEKVCPAAGICGGCCYQGVPYKDQLAEKERYVRKLCGGFAPVKPVVGMKDPLHYRNKVHAVFSRDKRGNVISGIYEEDSHRVVPIDECRIENQKADEIIRTIRDLLKSFKVRIYDEDTGFGLFRHVLIRTGHVTGQILVVLVLAAPILPSKKNFVKSLRDKHPEISTVVLNVNDKNTSMVLGERNITLYGKGYIEDELCGMRFRISPSSFYQVNVVQTELLYQKAIDLADLTGRERVLDAYCGTGTIGIIASEHAGQVIGVELNRDAARDAVSNAKANARTNIHFVNEDAGEYMLKAAAAREHFDVVIMDPPRAGSSEEFLKSIKVLSPDRVVYVSCNPETLARDVMIMKKMGYIAKEFYPYDLFPFTSHVETVCLMSRKDK